jgi:hypothetical protein
MERSRRLRKFLRAGDAPLMHFAFSFNLNSGPQSVSHLRAAVKAISFIVAFAALTLQTRAADMPSSPGLGVTGLMFSNHLAALRQSVPLGFSIVVARPFIVLGDEPVDILQMRAEKTVKWAVDMLKQDYFTRDPDELIDVWLFKDDASYRTNALRLFGDTPTTPFGYYSAQHHALVMNIATGGGTLVHEIVHPFMRANFPQCPAWFNEGLASLYEQSAEQSGHIRGLVNWRYQGLEQDIKAGKLTSFRQLTAMSDNEFYGGPDNPKYSDHYAQARYLCYYLQEKGLLVKFYREFSASARTDPTGYETLKRVLGENDMDKFQKQWEKFILALRAA